MGFATDMFFDDAMIYLPSFTREQGERLFLPFVQHRYFQELVYS